VSVSLTAPKSLAAILGGALVAVVLAQILSGLLLVVIVIAVAGAVVIRERGRAASQLEKAEASGQALLAERNALGAITTMIAHQQPLEKTFAQVTRYASTLIGGTGARLEPLAGADLKSGQGRVRAIVMAGDEKWGTLVLDGLTATQLPAARLQLLQNLADLAGLAVATANTRAELVTQSRTDPLTGLANQRAFRRELAEEMSRARRHRRPLALILLDLDQFKAVNDAEGQLGGDRAMTEIAARIRGALRLEAHVARVGGDEFAVVLPECDSDGGFVTAERVRQAVSAAETAAGSEVTASAGVAALEPGEGALAFAGGTDDLLRAADAALYAAKRMGGDSTVRFTPKLDQTVPVNPETRRAPRADAAQSA
jgi:diguanylate cyclase (GGDEF)-like protein